MRIPRRPVVVLMFLLPLVAAYASPAPPLTGLKRVLDAADPHRIDADLRFLADDVMEGRGTGQKGGRLAALYLETRFRLLGLAPGASKDSYLQEVPLVGIETDPRTRFAITGGPRTFEARWLEDYVASAETQKETEEIDAPLVFVGYGITAPEYGWDDFKGADVKGKVLVMLVNDPPSDDPALFGGKALTYYGRWTYKFESAARAGAAGAILIHTDESAGYGWSVVRNSWGRERPYVALAPGGPPALQMASWVTESFGRDFLKAAGQDFDVLRRTAATREFRPVPLSLRAQATMVTKIRPIMTWNVVGLLRGSEYYATHPIIPTHLTAANINMDGTPVWGRPADFTFLGADRSSLRNVVDEASRALGFKVVADQHPEQGSFYRSDQFNFAKVGIPAFSLDPGLDYVGKPKGYGETIWKEYEEKRYHRPKDEYDPSFDLSGSAESARIALYVGYRVAQADGIPRWNNGDEFAAARASALAATSTTSGK